jgi:regulator of replication initiation timing
MEQENKRLRHENEQLKQRLNHLEAIIDIQKKVSQLLGQSYQPTPQDGQIC